MWDFFPCDGWFLGFSFAEEKRFCTKYWIFYSRSTWFLRKHTVYFSFWLNRFCQILIVNITARHDLSWRMGRVAVGLSAMGFCVGGGRNCPSGTRGSADLVGATLGFECGLQLLLELEHFGNRGSWEVLPFALFWAAFSSARWQLFGGGALIAVSQNDFPKQTYIDFI